MTKAETSPPDKEILDKNQPQPPEKFWDCALGKVIVRHLGALLTSEDGEAVVRKIESQRAARLMDYRTAVEESFGRPITYDGREAAYHGRSSFIDRHSTLPMITSRAYLIGQALWHGEMNEEQGARFMIKALQKHMRTVKGHLAQERQMKAVGPTSSFRKWERELATCTRELNVLQRHYPDTNSSH